MTDAPVTMPESAPTSQNPWNDPFTAPTRKALLDALQPEVREAALTLLGHLTARKGCRERVEWFGLPWRWTIAISHPGLDHPDLAYLVLSPDSPTVCIPVPVVGSGAPPPEKLTRPVRQVLERASIVAGYVWAEWPIPDADPVALEPLLEARVGG